MKVTQSLICNIITHWNPEIKIISKFVLSKFIKYDKNFVFNFNSKEKEIVDNMNITDFKDDIWDVHFDLKSD